MWPWETAKQAMEEKILPFIDREAQAIAAQNVANKNLQQAAATSLAQKGWDPEMGIPMVGKTQTQFSQLNPEEKNIISGTNVNLVGSLSGGVTKRADEYLKAVGKLASRELPAQQQALEVIKNEAQHQLTPQEYNAVRDWSDQKLVDKIYKRLETERNAVSEAGSKSVDTMPNLLNKTDNAQSTLSDIKLYHGGTAKDFNNYNVGFGEYGDTRMTEFPIGVYTTENKNIASKFGDVIEGTLPKDKKVLDLTNEKTVQDVWNKLGYKPGWISPTSNIQPDTEISYLGSQYKLVEDLINSKPELKQKLIDEGYAGIKFLDKTDSINHPTYAIFNPKDIQSQLPSPQSTLHDIKVYHGSRDKIDQFDLNHLNATYMHDGLGVNFTDNPDFAKMYSSGKNEWGELNKINDGKGFVYERMIPKDANILDVSSKSKKVSDVLSLNDFIDIASKGRDKQFARKNLERTARNYLTSLDNNMSSLEATTKASSMTDEQLLKIAYDRLKDKTFSNGEGLPDVFRSLIDVYGIKSDDMADVVRQFSKKTGIDVIKTMKPDGSSVYTVLSPEKLKNVAQAPKPQSTLSDIPKYNTPMDFLNSPEYAAKMKELEAMKRGAKPTPKSNNLYHTTPAENLDSIIKNGLTTGNKPRYEGVSGSNNISFSANEAGASYYGGPNDVMIRTKTSYKPKDLSLDLLGGGEGNYITNTNVPPEALEVKINGKWQSLSQLPSPQSTSSKAMQSRINELKGVK